jgi:hypothetical protein
MNYELRIIQLRIHNEPLTKTQKYINKSKKSVNLQTL